MKRELHVGGFVPFSATDYPDHLCAVVFCQGCPWRCGYCHNAHLQPATAASPIHWQDILLFLSRRRGLLDAVVFSGGEPTMQCALAGAIGEVKALGFKVGLHTAGIYPQKLSKLLPLVDWVGLDVKAPFDRYGAVTRVTDSGARAKKSLDVVLASGVSYELRTTVDKSVLGDSDVGQLSAALARRGARGHVLQACRDIRA